ncbi:hypothetical protein CRD_00090 [Raphidiopsis brookii D9]|nr:hypothetical protein CRD_00090 [Raphidiopsis brookii D9]
MTAKIYSKNYKLRESSTKLKFESFCRTYTNFKVDEGATGIIEFESNGDRKNLSGEFVHIVECRKNNLDFAFVPIKYSTAKDANLRCSNSNKQ